MASTRLERFPPTRGAGRASARAALAAMALATGLSGTGAALAQGTPPPPTAAPTATIPAPAAPPSAPDAAEPAPPAAAATATAAPTGSPPPPGYGSPGPDYPPPYGPPGYDYPPPGYGPPPPPPPGYGYGYEAPPLPPPRELPYEEGAPVPEGYHVGTQIRKGLVIAGAVSFGTLYLISVGVAAGQIDEPGVSADDWAPMFVPIAGPFIALGTVEPTASGTVGLLLDGLGQSAGLAMLIAGLAAQTKVLIRNDLGGAQVTVAPALVGRSTMGLGVTAEM